ncbi:Hypothetical predicted protein [Paramuricea clavata]|uniref:Uncharacterized protein n=1 Tax=Paramuricea clavata TaxID=317549 RepID=A0A7D9I8Q0_PARCT|nr:Hypothetical predicted protein [Paramuricea clavata]
MYLIKHKNITDCSLNKSNLHLNKFGSASFANNFIEFFTTAFRSTEDIQYPTFTSSFRTHSETVEVYDCPPDISPQISDNMLNPAEVLKTLKCFRVGHLNITSLVKHVDELRVYMRYEPFDILSINERRLDADIARDTVGIQGYDMETLCKSIEETFGNPKLMWKYLNCLLNRKSKRTGIQAIKTVEGDVVESQTIAELFNEYFSNIGPTLSNQITSISSQGFESYMTHEASGIFEFATVDSTIVLNELENLNSSKSIGPDNITAKLGIFPDNLKVARVSPIYKEGNKKERGNYRPISVLTAVPKLFEKLVCIQLTDYLNANDILSPCQPGFRQNHSTMSSLLSNSDSWLVNMDAGLVNGVVFLDLRNAFDMVDHEILIKKLKIYGVQNTVLKWFISYLFDRKQFCKVEIAASSTKNIRCGVPQGSNLGPLLFFLYVNDLPHCLRHSSAEMYADDTNLTACSHDINNLQAILNSDLNNIHQWIVANKLTLNVGKTEYMIIGTILKSDGY